MEAIRNGLINRIDEILAQLATSSELPTNSRVQFEALVYTADNAVQSTRSIVVGDVDLNVVRVHQNHHIPTISPTLPHSRPAEALLSPPESESGRFFHEKTSAPPRVPNTEVDVCSNSRTSRHKSIGGLRLGLTEITPPRTPSPIRSRQLESDDRRLPKRRKQDKEHPHKLEQSTIGKLIDGIWEQIHSSGCLALGDELRASMGWVVDSMAGNSTTSSTSTLDFRDVTRCCRQISTGSRTARAYEVIVQAHWVDCYDARIAALQEERRDLKTSEVRKAVMAEACSSFSWTEKELRNRMAIWKGYREIKNTAGWSALIFAGPGIYRFCKYRMGFDADALAKLQSMSTRFEVAADTIQPQWRQLLSLVGEPTQLHWRGHPHDWAVSKKKEPLPLSMTYRQWDPDFSFQHLEESIIDKTKFGDHDPRKSEEGPNYTCGSCSRTQSLNAEVNACECYPELYSPNPKKPCPVQIYRTENGKNNGLVACCAFERGQIVGEFVGLITKGLADVDVMQSQAGTNEQYQIWQGRMGNYTRFINHSCVPNCQFQTFSWLGVQRIIVVSRGVIAGKELTVDYSDRYWANLDKTCLCGEARCRYKSRAQATVG